MLGSSLPGLVQEHLPILFGLCLFGVVAVITLSIANVVQNREDIRRRALAVDRRVDDPMSDRRSLRHQRLAGTANLLKSVGANFVPTDKKSVSLIRQRLTQAGYFHPAAVTIYFTVRVVLAVLAPVATFIAFMLGEKQMETTSLMSFLVGASAAGLMLPSFWVSWRQKKMQQQARDGFPDFMDLMVVCAEAGIGLDAAINRVSGELARGYPHLGANLHVATLELRAGRPLVETFTNLGKRLGIEEAMNLGSLLQQSEELGTSLSNALRVFSDEMRDKRISKAEEKAHALPAKMAVPLTMFVFPVIIVVLLLPAIVKISVALK